jgi:hypothetical protein
MTIAPGDDVLASDVIAVEAIANAALIAAGGATATASTALTNSEEAQGIANAASAAAAVALSIPALGLVTTVGGSDIVAIGHAGSTVAITVANFNAGVNASIASVASTAATAESLAATAGTTASSAVSTAASALGVADSALTAATAAGTTATTALTNAASALAEAEVAATAAAAGFSIGGLTVVSAVGATDLVPIEQTGSTVAVTTAALLNAETIDLLTASGAASDTDTFLTGQGTNVLTRQTLAAVWTWLQTHIPGYKLPVLEVTANLTVDATYAGKILVVTSAGVTISPNYTLMGAGFECEIVTSGSGTVTWGGGVTATNGGTGLPVGAYAKFLAFSSSAGNVVLASVGTASGGGVSPPGPISALTAGAATSTTLAFTWSAPSSGGAVTYYQVQYRLTGTSTWTAAPGTSVTSATLSGLTSSSEFDVQVAAGNSGGLSAFSATVNGTTAIPSVAAPGMPTSLAVGTTTTTTAPLTWTAPSSGGAVSTYTVQYRVTSLGGAWTQVTGISVAAATITGLVALTGYDFQVAAVGAGGTSSFTATTAGTTASAPSTTAAWNTYQTTLVHASGWFIYNLFVTSGVAPNTVAIGLSSSQTVPPNPMPATADTMAGNFNGNEWGTYTSAPATAGTYYGWAIGYSSVGAVLFTIVGPPVTVT